MSNTVTISKKEYEQLKKDSQELKELQKEREDAFTTQLKASLADLKAGRVHRYV